MMWDYGYGHSFGTFGIFGGIFMIVIWGIIIWGIVVAVQWLTKSGTHESGERTNKAIAILEERYAKGEVSQEEFAEKKKDLKN